MEIFFDGYCPESLIKGIKAEMRLNEDDFWESEATGLQMTISMPYATILRWRGKGKFRQSSEFASNSLVGLIMTEAKNEVGKEILPDEENLIKNKFDLERYIREIFESKEKFDAVKFNPHDPIFKEQERYINTISDEDFHKLLQLFDTIKEQGYDGSFMSSETFHDLHKMLYDLKLIFDFKWMVWHKGWEIINDTTSDYSNCSLLEISMYLTAIFRADRFSEGKIEANFKNGNLEKLFNALRCRTPCP